MSMIEDVKEMKEVAVDGPGADSVDLRPTGAWAMSLIDAVMPVATVVLMIYFALVTNAFMTSGNLLAVATQSAPTIIVAVVFAMLLMAGYVDLSVGSTMAVSGVAAGLAFNELGVVPGLAIGLGIGMLAGLVNGVLIGFLSLSPIVVTLGMLAAGRGMAQALSPDSVFGFPDAVTELGSGKLLGVTYLVWIAAAVTAACVVAMSLLPIGRHIIAIGVNSRAAFLVGIKVKPIVFLLYVAVGLSAAIAGLLQVARLNSAPSGSLGLGFEVTVLTAVLLGGIPFDGGRGAIWRVVLGVWLMGVLSNGLTLLNYGPEVSGVITGSVLVVAAGLEGLRAYLRRT
jgi:ribose transport system permease protein